MADLFESITVIPNATEHYDQVWAVVNRANGRMIEFFENRLKFVEDGDDMVVLREDQIRLDSCVTYNASATIFTGLDHLEGETVGILADGDVLDEDTVVDGSVVTSTAVTKVCIGLPYYSDLETLDIEVGVPDGITQGAKIKVGGIIYRFVDSCYGQIGPDSDNLYDAFTDLIISRNQSELMFSPSDYDWSAQDVSNAGPYLFTGDIRRPMGAGWKKGGRSFYRQTKPVSVTITAVIPEISPGGPV
jgi:hypothetical protein